MRLTNKRRVFIEEYLTCWNATEAARRAGYKYPNKQGPRLLVNVGIQAEIQERLEEKKMSADEVLTRLKAQAVTDPTEFIDENGIIDWKALKEAVKERGGPLVKKITHYKGKRSSIELYDAQAALALLGRHHQLFADRQIIERKGFLPVIVYEGLDVSAYRNQEETPTEPESDPGERGQGDSGERVVGVGQDADDL